MAGRSWSGVSHPFMRPAGRPGVSPILDGALLIGEYPTPDDVVWLREEHGVDAVLSLQDDFDLAYKSLDAAALSRAYAGAGVQWHRFGITDGDSSDVPRVLGVVLETLHGLLEKRRCVYVHCNAGFNRAPTIAIAYLHAHCGLGIDEAYEKVRERRACAPYLTVLRGYFGADPAS